MHDGAAAPTSIRRRLLVFLSGALLLMIAGASSVTYWVALRAANDAYDRSLLDPALDIADNLRIDATGARVDLPQKALEVLVYDHLDTVIYPGAFGARARSSMGTRSCRRLRRWRRESIDSSMAPIEAK